MADTRLGKLKELEAMLCAALDEAEVSALPALARQYRETLKEIEEVEGALEGADLVIGGVSSFGVEWFGDYVLPRIAEGTKLSSEYFYLIPVSRTYEIEFKVDIYQAGVKLDTYEHSIKIPIDLEKGKSYSLNADLAPETVNPDAHLFPIEFQVNKITDWDPATQNIVSVPNNN